MFCGGSVAFEGTFKARFYWVCEGADAAGWLRIASEALTSLQSVAASAFAANKLMLRLALHFAFADQAPLAVKTRMAALGAKRLARIGNRIQQLCTAARVAAA